jgi:hypothetical protein
MLSRRAAAGRNLKLHAARRGSSYLKLPPLLPTPETRPKHHKWAAKEFALRCSRTLECVPALRHQGLAGAQGARQDRSSIQEARARGAPQERRRPQPRIQTSASLTCAPRWTDVPLTCPSFPQARAALRPRNWLSPEPLASPAWVSSLPCFRACCRLFPLRPRMLNDRPGDMPGGSISGKSGLPDQRQGDDLIELGGSSERCDPPNNQICSCTRSRKAWN